MYLNAVPVLYQAVQVPVPAPGFFQALARTLQAHDIAFLEQTFPKNVLSVFAQQALEQRIESLNLLLLHVSVIYGITLTSSLPGLVCSLRSLSPRYSFIKPAHLFIRSRRKTPCFSTMGSHHLDKHILETACMHNKGALIKLDIIIGQCLTLSNVASHPRPLRKA